MTGGIKVAIFLCLAILMVVAFWLFDFQPKKDKIKQLEEGPGGIAELTATRDADKAYVDNIEQYEKQLKEAQAELDKLQVSLSSNNEDFLPSYLEDIEKLVKYVRESRHDWDFVIENITPGAPAAGAAGGCTTYSMNMSMAGQYETVQYFFNCLSDKSLFKQVVVVSGVTMSPTGSKQQQGVQTLTLTLPLTAYQFTKGGVQ